LHNRPPFDPSRQQKQRSTIWTADRPSDRSRVSVKWLGCRPATFYNRLLYCFSTVGQFIFCTKIVRRSFSILCVKDRNISCFTKYKNNLILRLSNCFATVERSRYSSRISRRVSVGGHYRCRALDSHVDFSSLPRLELLIMASCLSLCSDDVYKTFETIVTWMKFIQFSFLFVFLIYSFRLFSVSSTQFCDVVSTVLHFHFFLLVMFFLVCLFLTFRNHYYVFGFVFLFRLFTSACVILYVTHDVTWTVLHSSVNSLYRADDWAVTAFDHGSFAMICVCLSLVTEWMCQVSRNHWSRSQIWWTGRCDRTAGG
jgi:hypothetical protein